MRLAFGGAQHECIHLMPSTLMPNITWPEEFKIASRTSSTPLELRRGPRKWERVDLVNRIGRAIRSDSKEGKPADARRRPRPEYQKQALFRDASSSARSAWDNKTSIHTLRACTGKQRGRTTAPNCSMFTYRRVCKCDRYDQGGDAHGCYRI